MWVCVKIFQIILLISVFFAVVFTNKIELNSFIVWCGQSAVVVIIVFMLTLSVNVLFFREELKGITNLVKRLLVRKA